MKKLTIRKGKCVECPYKPENKSRLNKAQLAAIEEADAIFPCHMEMEKVIGSCNSGVEVYAEVVDEFIICNGLAETRKLK